MYFHDHQATFADILDIEADIEMISESQTGGTCYQCGLPVGSCTCDVDLFAPYIEVDCTACGGDGEVSVRTEWPARSSDIDTVPCATCGGKGTIGRRED